jgi:hypothetical protein
MKKVTALIIFLSLISFRGFSQNINGRFSSSLYMFERFDTTDVSDNYVRSYQMLNLNINEGDFSLRTSMNLESDLSADIKDDPRVRVYNLYLEGRNLLDMFTVKLGRQPLITNVAGGLFDGANVDFKFSNYKLTGFYGGNVPDYQKLKLIDNWGDNYVLGGKFTAFPLEDLQLTLGYIKKNYKRQDYWAIRLDEDLNPINTLIRNNSNQYQYLSAEASYIKSKLFDLDAKVEFDVNLEEFSKLELNASYYKIEDLSLDVYYNYREPRVKYNSIFSVFDYGNTQEIELGGSYKLSSLFTVSGRFGNVIYRDNENSGRITVGMYSNYGSITYRKNLGDAGELDALSVYSAYTLFDGVLTPSVGLSFTGYKLSDDSEKNNLTSLLAGLNFRPWRELSLDLQGQYMDNQIYKNDFRFLIKANYWFNTNF